jgi:two-component system response regulator AtoC
MPVSGRILIVDDEPKICSMLRRNLQSIGHTIECCTDPNEGLQRLKEQHFDVVITDLRMPGVDGMELLQRAKHIRPDCEVVMMTAHATVETAREALKRGALDYIRKPIDIDGELKPLINALFSALPGERGEEASEPRRRVNPVSVGKGDELEGFVGRGPAMQALLGKVRKIARSDAPVLLQGESGTGKEVVSGLIHRLSRRSERPMIKINCAALPESLLESELFGHAKGSFTGAHSDRQGLFQAADGGTLLLDEIGEISRTFQPKLLRVLQDGEFHRIGDARHAIKVDVRVIAATNRNMIEAVQNGEFRQDLYYRLNVVPLAVPPLRDRIDDLSDLLDHFVSELAERAGQERRGEVRFADEAIRVMRKYPWPGNIRELANAVEYALVLAEGDEIHVQDLPVAIQDHDRMWGDHSPSRVARAGDDAGTLEDIEMRCILQAMSKTGFNRTRAAELLGVTRRTLGYRISKYGLEGELDRLRVEGGPGEESRLSDLGDSGGPPHPVGA